MKRKTFLLTASVVAFLFSIVMLLKPGMMTAKLLAAHDPTNDLLIQIIGGNLLAVAFLDLLVRNESWSKTLRAVFLANIVMHVMAILLDWYGYTAHIFSVNGILMGTIVHVIMIAGFSFYAFRKSTQDIRIAMGVGR